MEKWEIFEQIKHLESNYTGPNPENICTYKLQLTTL